RGSHFYLALYWALQLAAQDENPALKKRFQPVADALSASEQQIVLELNTVQGHTIDIGGYYRPDPVKTSDAMRPSATFNQILQRLA
ncbi:MAG: NADP-dependent isocitrate dehydrogenase, partial [Planctomycetaceae bacterium]|nr:NADP-dependent isocitrate dehydrogenase [Planctomycetaceae bacterium]